MSDFRISDTLAQSRGLNEFRHLDQAEKALAEKIHTEHSVGEIIRDKNKLEEVENPHLRADDQHKGHSQHHQQGQQNPKKEHKDPAPPEINEGHILDLKA